MGRHPKLKVKHTKTFGGCWTCRTRHLKCDEQRPECSQCIKFGVRCEGYGVRLIWTPDWTLNPSRKTKHERRRVVVSSYECLASCIPVLPVEQVDRAMSFLDDADCAFLDRDTTVSHGPFGVFDSRRQRRACRAIEHLDDASTSDSDEPWTQLPCSLGLDGPFPDDYSLFDHWLSFRAPSLVPAEDSPNPFQSYFTQFALTTSNATCNWGGQKAVFHAICTISASSQALLSQESGNSWLQYQLSNLYRRHRHLSLKNLQECITSTNDPLSQRTSLAREKQVFIMATIILLICNDIVVGEVSQWRIHLRGGMSLISSFGVDSQMSDDPILCTIVQQFLCLALFGSGHCAASGSAHELFYNGEISAAQKGIYCLDQVFGIPATVFESIASINNVERRGPLPEERSVIWESDESNAYSDHKLINNISSSLINCHQRLFHLSYRIFARRVRDHVPVIHLQDLVVASVAMIEHIEDKSSFLCATGLLWPFFITACECSRADLRARMMTWFEKQKRRGYMNIMASKNVVLETWGVDVRWQDFMFGMGADFLLV